MWSKCMWALCSWLWASCSKKLWYITIKRFRKELMERSSCFLEDSSSGSLAACSQGGLGSPEATVSMDGNLWLGIPQSATSRDHELGPPEDTFPNLTWNRTFRMDWRSSSFKMISWAGSCRALCTDKVRRKGTQGTGPTLVLAYCNHRFSARVSTPLPCSFPRQVSVQLCQPLLED